MKQDDINTLEKLCKLYLDNLYIFNNDINELIDNLDIKLNNCDEFTELELKKIFDKRYKLFMIGLKEKYNRLIEFINNNYNSNIEKILFNLNFYKKFEDNFLFDHCNTKKDNSKNILIKDYIDFFTKENDKNINVLLLSDIKTRLNNLDYKKWFQDIIVYKYKNKKYKIIVPTLKCKKYLVSNYYNFILERLSYVLGEIIAIDIVTENEIKEVNFCEKSCR